MAFFGLNPLNNKQVTVGGRTFVFNGTKNVWEKISSNPVIATASNANISGTLDAASATIGNANVGNVTVTGVTATTTSTNTLGAASATIGNLTVTGTSSGVVADSISISANQRVNSLGIGTAASSSAGEIRATGDITAFYSDERLKDFHGVIENALTKINQISGYYYTANKTAQSLGYNDKMQVGVSAQEIQQILPEVVETAPISHNIEEDYLTVKYEKIVPLLIEAIKEQNRRIEYLENKINKD